MRDKTFKQTRKRFCGITIEDNSDEKNKESRKEIKVGDSTVCMTRSNEGDIDGTCNGEFVTQIPKDLAKEKNIVKINDHKIQIR